MDDEFLYAGYGNITPFGSSKNVITVGALLDIPEEDPVPTEDTMTSFSSWGPTDDGRIKPDIVANGFRLISMAHKKDNEYFTFSGTSMSSPTVAGTVALLTQMFRRVYDGAEPTPEIMKSILIHTAIDGGSSPGPDYRFGYGLMDAQAATDFIAQNQTGESLLKFDSVSEATNEYQLSYDGSGPIKATLVWTDPPGNPVLGGLDETTPLLVNDLDIQILGPDGRHFPWTLDPLNPDELAQQDQTNHRDNVEQVYIQNPVPGDYTLVVSGQVNFGFQQTYSLCISGLQEDRTQPSVTLFHPNANRSSRGTVPFQFYISGDNAISNFRLSVNGEIYDNNTTGEIDGEIAYTEPRTEFLQSIPVKTNQFPNGLQQVSVELTSENGETNVYEYELLMFNAGDSSELLVDGPFVLGEISHSNTENRYRFSVPSSGYYAIETHPVPDLPFSTSLDPLLELSGPIVSNNIIDTNDDGGVELHSKIVAFLRENNNYFVTVNSLFDTVGFYALDIIHSEEETFDPPTPIEINGEMVEANIGDIGNTKWFSFTTPPLREMSLGGRLRFQTPQSDNNPLRNTKYRLFREGLSTPLETWQSHDGIWEILEGNQNYRISVSGNKSKGRFQLRVLDPEVKIISLNGDPVEDSIEEKNEEDWFSFSTPQQILSPVQNRFLIEAATPEEYEAEGYEMRLFHESNLNRVLKTGDDREPIWSVLDKNQRYFLKVTPDPATSTIPYNLTVRQPQLNSEPPTELEVNGPSKINEFETEDLEEVWYQFTPQNQAYHFIVVDFLSNDFEGDFNAAIYDEAFLPYPISQIDFSGKNRGRILIYLQPNRTHYIAISTETFQGGVSVAVRDLNRIVPVTINRTFSNPAYTPGEPVEVQLSPFAFGIFNINTITIVEKPPEAWEIVEPGIAQRRQSDGTIHFNTVPGQVITYTIVPPLDAEGCQSFIASGQAAGLQSSASFGPIESVICPAEEPSMGFSLTDRPFDINNVKVVDNPFVDEDEQTIIENWMNY